MDFFPTIVDYLEKLIAEFQSEAKRINRIAETGQVADSRQLKKLTRDNARALAALNIKDILNSTPEEDLNRIIARVQSHLTAEAEDTEGQLDTVRIYVDMLEGLTTYRNTLARKTLDEIKESGE